jgi:hypothetical protein
VCVYVCVCVCVDGVGGGQTERKMESGVQEGERLWCLV